MTNKLYKCTRCRIVTNIIHVEVYNEPFKECFCKLTQDGLRPTTDCGVTNTVDLKLDLNSEQKLEVSNLAPFANCMLVVKS